MIKSKDELLALLPLKKAIVKIADHEVEVTELTAGQRDEINQMLASEHRDVFDINATIAIMGCAFLSADDKSDLLDGSLGLLMPLVDKITELSGMADEEGTDEAKKN